MSTIAEEVDRIAAQSLTGAVAVDSLLNACAVNGVQRDCPRRYVFRDGSALAQDVEGNRWLAYPAPATCCCSIEEGHTCGEVDLPEVDPRFEEDDMAEVEIWEERT